MELSPIIAFEMAVLLKLLYYPIGYILYLRFKWDERQLIRCQERQLRSLLRQAGKTDYGMRYGFEEIRDVYGYQQSHPLRTYEDLKGDIERMAEGERDVLWPGHTVAMAITSGSSGGKKYIPLTSASIRSQQRGRMLALANYIGKYRKTSAMLGPMLLFSSAVTASKFGKYEATVISSILAQRVPGFIRKQHLPSKAIDALSTMDERMEQMVKEASASRHRLVGMIGFPPLLLNLLRRMKERIPGQLAFDQLQLIITSGIPFAQLGDQIMQLLGKPVDRIETYPATEGFIGFSPERNSSEFCLLPRNGIFYEFIPLAELDRPNPQRIWIKEVQTDTTYALVLSTNSGLWSYLLGDLVRFTQLDPWRFMIVGRLGKVLSLVSENVGMLDVQRALSLTSERLQLVFGEFLVSGTFRPDSDKQHYEWLIECETAVASLTLSQAVHEALMECNHLYYFYSINGAFDLPEIRVLKPGSVQHILQQDPAFHEQSKTPYILTDHQRFTEYKKQLTDLQWNT